MSCDACVCACCARLTDCPVYPKGTTRCTNVCVDGNHMQRLRPLRAPAPTKDIGGGILMRDDSAIVAKAKRLCRHFELQGPPFARQDPTAGGSPMDFGKLWEAAPADGPWPVQSKRKG